MDKLSTYKSIKEEAEIRKFARFKQAERARAGEVQGKVPGVGKEGGTQEGDHGPLKGQNRAVEIVGEKRELMEGQERGERQSKGKTLRLRAREGREAGKN